MRNRLIAIIALLTMILTMFTACGESADLALPFEVAGDEYTIAIVSDTQFLSRDNRDAFFALTEFCESKQESLRIKYLIHTGDIVNSPYETTQWENADYAMDELKTLPYGVLPGNHDTGNSDRKYTDYSSYFGESRFEGAEWYGMSHEDNRGHYDLITMGTTQFVVVYISDDPSSCCVDFANDTFAKYPDRVGVLCTHKYLENDGSHTEMGEYLHEKIVEPNKNIAMVICGHNDTTVYTTIETEDGREVGQLMTNYQDGESRTQGYALFLVINETEGTMEGITYSPYMNDFVGHVEEEITDEFTVDLPWQK